MKSKDRIVSLRDAFPIFKNKELQNEPFIYLDNAATTQKPQIMIDTLVDFYTNYNANIHRGVYPFAETATQRFEDARATVAQLIGAKKEEIIWVKNATEGINLVAFSWLMQHISPHDEILLTEYEHHANLLPWQRVAQQTGAKLKFLPILPDGTLDYASLPALITSRTKFVSCTAISNVTGIYTDLHAIIAAAHAVDAKVLVDASQMPAHERMHVADMQADFVVFSGHKVYGPTGIGVLYIKQALQDRMVPYQLGGGMVFEVNWHDVRFASGAQKFEAGTPPIAEAIALAETMRWLYSHDMHAISKHQTMLLNMLLEGLLSMPHIRIIGPLKDLRTKGHLVSFVVDTMHAHDVAAYLGNYGIAVRAGHHCAQPLAKKLGVEASVRVSLACYNTAQEIEFFLQIMQTMKKL